MADIKEAKPIPIDSKYRKILIAAKRSKQIQKGAQPRVHMGNSKATRVALEEVERGLINYEIIEKGEK
ncbi:MAG TPA: DNA-directed RNA polymerase subunit omega [Blastocatellia bacterium]|nr:DNA-directed RNA polymerase subunit omega [Blastocatellia bacterium]